MDFDLSKELSERGWLDNFCEVNWAKVPQADKEAALAPLREFIKNIPPEHAGIVAEWTEQYKNGFRIGSDNAWFHMSTGMQIRNILREGLNDHKLPEVMYDYGPSQNWDDYYMAALREVLGLPAPVLLPVEER